MNAGDQRMICLVHAVQLFKMKIATYHKSRSVSHTLLIHASYENAQSILDTAAYHKAKRLTGFDQ